MLRHRPNTQLERSTNGQGLRAKLVQTTPGGRPRGSHSYGWGSVLLAVSLFTGKSDARPGVKESARARDVINATTMVSASARKKTRGNPSRKLNGRNTTTGVRVERTIGRRSRLPLHRWLRQYRSGSVVKLAHAKCRGKQDHMAGTHPSKERGDVRFGLVREASIVASGMVEELSSTGCSTVTRYQE